MRILIVEDEVHLAEALTQILKKNHYSVDAVHDGQAGLDNALSGIYDLLLLDIMLPEMDGIALLRTIRAEGIATLSHHAHGQRGDFRHDRGARLRSRRLRRQAVFHGRAFGPNPRGFAAKRRGRA